MMTIATPSSLQTTIGLAVVLVGVPFVLAAYLPGFLVSSLEKLPLRSYAQHYDAVLELAQMFQVGTDVSFPRSMERFVVVGGVGGVLSSSCRQSILSLSSSFSS